MEKNDSIPKMQKSKRASLILVAAGILAMLLGTAFSSKPLVIVPPGVLFIIGLIGYLYNDLKLRLGSSVKESAERITEQYNSGDPD